MCSFLQVTELFIDRRQATNMSWYKRNHVGWHAVTNCIWSYDRHHDSRRTFSYKHAHTIIQSYTYNYAILLHTGIWNIRIKSCTYSWSLRQHRCSSAGWLSNLWSMRVPPVQFTRVMVESLVSAPATRAVYQIGHILCPAPWRSSWFSNCWCLRLPPAQFSKLIVGSLVSAPPVQSTGVMVESLVSAAATCCLPNRLSNLLPLGLRPGSWPGRFSKCWCPRWSSAGWLSDPRSAWWLDQVASLFSVPATRAIDRIDFQTVGLCARARCSLPS